MTRPDGTYEEWIAFERIGSIGKWQHAVWESKKKADRAASDIMLKDTTIICLHHSATKPDGERPESGYGQRTETESVR